jgi:NAD(P)H dehydrogenase (quinone)
VLDYQRRLLAAGHLAFVFPIWREAMPAATKGFLDRVLTKGVMYEELPRAKGNPFRNRMTNLGGVSVLSVMTTPDKAYRWWYRDPLTKILFKGTFAKIGVKNLRWTNYASVTAKTSAQRAQLLQQTEQAFASL